SADEAVATRENPVPTARQTAIRLFAGRPDTERLAFIVRLLDAEARLEMHMWEAADAHGSCVFYFDPNDRPITLYDTLKRTRDEIEQLGKDAADARKTLAT